MQEPHKSAGPLAGMLAGLHVLALMGRDGRSVSELAAELPHYSASGEINST